MADHAFPGGLPTLLSMDHLQVYAKFKRRSRGDASGWSQARDRKGQTPGGNPEPGRDKPGPHALILV